MMLAPEFTVYVFHKNWVAFVQDNLLYVVVPMQFSLFKCSLGWYKN